MWKKVLPGGLLVLLVAAAGILLAQRFIPREIGDVLPSYDRERITRCDVYRPWGEDLHLTDGALEEFLSALEDTEYRYDGAAEEAVEGESYHITFQGIPGDILLTDRKLVYVDGRRYTASRDLTELLQ